VKQFKNIKTGRVYYVIDDNVVNATNRDDGKRMVLYARDKQWFVREYEEFNQKFEEWKGIRTEDTKESM